MQPSAITAEINYLAPMDEGPVFYMRQRHLGRLALEPHRVTITNARVAREAPNLERDGFVRINHPFGIPDREGEDDDVIEEYRRHAGNVVQSLTGADCVASSSVLRRKAGETDRVKPVRHAHIDISRSSFEEFVMRRFAEDPVRDPLTLARYAAYNLWRVTTPPPQDSPLAICAASSVDESELIVDEARAGFPGRRCMLLCFAVECQTLPPLVQFSGHDHR